MIPSRAKGWRQLGATPPVHTGPLSAKNGQATGGEQDGWLLRTKNPVPNFVAGSFFPVHRLARRSTSSVWPDMTSAPSWITYRLTACTNTTEYCCCSVEHSVQYIFRTVHLSVICVFPPPFILISLRNAYKPCQNLQHRITVLPTQYPTHPSSHPVISKQVVPQGRVKVKSPAPALYRAVLRNTP